MSASSPDVLIVGGGVIGLSVADAALRRDMSVLLLERERLGARASWASAGMLTCRPWPDPKRKFPDYIDLTQASIALHAQWAARLLDETEIDVGFRRCGALQLLTAEMNTPAELANLQRRLEGCKERNVRATRLTSADVHALEPHVDHTLIAAALEFPDDAQVRPPRLLRALALACRQREAQIKEGVNVAEIMVENGRARGVRAADGTCYSAASVVVCAGAWTAQLMQGVAERATEDRQPISKQPEMGVSPQRIAKITPVRGQIVCYRTDHPDLCTRMLTVDEQYIVPRGDGVFLAGSTTERVGFEAVTTREGQGSLRQFAARWLPALNGVEPLQGWADLRPGLKGPHPLLGSLPGIPNLYVAAGHYRNGVCLAPVSGEIIAALLAGETTNFGF